MPTDPERLEWLGERTMRLLCAAMDRDPDEVCRLLDEISERYDAAGMFGVCCALAQSVLTLAFPEFKRGDGTLDDGAMLAVQHLPGASDDPHALWAVRFIAAYANGDMDTTDALFFGSMPDADAHTGGVIALIALAADIARQREAEVKGEPAS
jgi:hypothetical protein